MQGVKRPGAWGRGRRGENGEKSLGTEGKSLGAVTKKNWRRPRTRGSTKKQTPSERPRPFKNGRCSYMEERGGYQDSKKANFF